MMSTPDRSIRAKWGPAQQLAYSTSGLQFASEICRDPPPKKLGQSSGLSCLQALKMVEHCSLLPGAEAAKR